jgi:triosephosphate isomerase
MTVNKLARALIGGNWKCNGTVASVKQMAEVLNKAGIFSANSEVVIAAPSLHLQTLKSIIRPDVSVASEDVSFQKGYGAFTGELTADMLLDSGIKWTLTGHSERRVGFGMPGESSQIVAVKTKNAVESGMNVILCVGEHLKDRQDGKTMTICAEQLDAVKKMLKETDWKRIVVAYEPVWAIGTGVTATPKQAQDTHSEIRKWLSKNISATVAGETRIIYGGSATAANCGDLYAQSDINGFLVGGASLKPEFVNIINSTK